MTSDSPGTLRFAWLTKAVVLSGWQAMEGDGD